MIQGALNIKKLLAAMGRLDASDLHIKVGIPPTYRIGGSLRPIDGDPVTDEEADHLLDPLLSEIQKKRFAESGDLDFAWHLEDPDGGGGDRFRINLLRSGNHTHAAIRRVKADIPSYAELHLPEVYSNIVHRERDGLVLIVGVTGSGKSSTLAAMVDEINASRGENIITIEDPVEYRFIPKQSIISQREIGIDISGHEAKAVDAIDTEQVGSVVTLCAEEVCPVFPGDVEREHWPFEDPAAVEGSYDERLAAFRRVRDQIALRLGDFFAMF